MATFVYKAYDQLGNKKVGRIAVPSEMDDRRIYDAWQSFAPGVINGITKSTRITHYK